MKFVRNVIFGVPPHKPARKKNPFKIHEYSTTGIGLGMHDSRNVPKYCTSNLETLIFSCLDYVYFDKMNLGHYTIAPFEYVIKNTVTAAQNGREEKCFSHDSVASFEYVIKNTVTAALNWRKKSASHMCISLNLGQRELPSSATKFRTVLGKKETSFQKVR